ncbi:MAG: iron transporter [Planctomycetaceae bacterium]|nr:iron transporter [Planctomycetaceae bacterium]
MLIDQRGLQFAPRVRAMTLGQTLRFTNQDAETHNVHIENDFNQSMSPGQAHDFVPSRPGVLRLLCDIHSHMRGFVVVSASPWVRTCSRTGSFRFEGVPDGRYALNVWHEMGTQLRHEVVVEGDRSVRLEPLTLTVPEGSVPVAGFREYPIGEPRLRNAMQVAAVWLPPVGMEGMGEALGSDVIHLEADIRATEGNRNGFAKDEFVPYLKVAFSIVPTSGGPPIDQGEMMPMVARDGLHYGSSVTMPRAGSFRLIYRIQPPSSGGLGRRSDPVTGVAP